MTYNTLYRVRDLAGYFFTKLKQKSLQLIFAIIPPPGLLGGYPCFVISLAMIGLTVIVVGDLAEIFGCIVGLNPDVRKRTIRT